MKRVNFFLLLVVMIFNFNKVSSQKVVNCCVLVVNMCLGNDRIFKSWFRNSFKIDTSFGVRYEAVFEKGAQVMSHKAIIWHFDD